MATKREELSKAIEAYLGHAPMTWYEWHGFRGEERCEMPQNCCNPELRAGRSCWECYRSQCSEVVWNGPKSCQECECVGVRGINPIW